MSWGTVARILIKEFGKGINYRKIMTQTLNGKTLTKVIDKDGKVLVERAKVIEKNTVGDKKVITKKIAEELNGTNGHKYVYDRVYSSGELVGARKVEQFSNNLFNKEKHPLELIDGSSKYITKVCKDGAVTKSVRNGITSSSYAHNMPIGANLTPYDTYEATRHFAATHNAKGFPYPSTEVCADGLLGDYPSMRYMSFKDMQETVKKYNKNLYSELKAFGLETNELEYLKYYSQTNPHLKIELPNFETARKELDFMYDKSISDIGRFI